MIKTILILSLLLLIINVNSNSKKNEDITIIAHRGASQKYPENTMLAMKMALEESDYIEQDLQFTKDNKIVVFHDKYLNNVTDVKIKFNKNRSRKDGKYYVIDFTYDELKKLKITDRYYRILWISKNATKIRNYSQYYNNVDARIPLFIDVLKLIRDYNIKNNKNIGIYPEIKDVDFYKKEGVDISLEIIKVLVDNGYTSKNDRIYIQSFSFDELKRLKNDIFKKYNIDYNLTYLISKKSMRDIIKDKTKLEEISNNVTCVGLSKNIILKNESKNSILNEIQKKYICIHVYTFNEENKNKKFKNVNEEINYFKENYLIDGVFKD